MTEALFNQDQETYDKLFNYRVEQFNNLLRIESDLVYYGHFTIADIQNMKVVERRYHTKLISERLEAISKQRKQQVSHVKGRH